MKELIEAENIVEKALNNGELKQLESQLRAQKAAQEARESEIRNQYVPFVPKNNSIAQANRWTGKHHEHKREIARRLKKLNKTS